MDLIENENGAPDRPRRSRAFVLDYSEAPALGTEISCPKSGRLTLFRIEARKVAVEKRGPVLLRWRSGGGAEYTSGLRGRVCGPVVPLAYRLDLSEPPEIGAIFECQHGPVTLVSVRDRKRDVARWGPFILRWRCRDGLEYTSGLNGAINLPPARRPKSKKRRTSPAKTKPGPDVSFAEVPGLGATVWTKGRQLVLYHVAPRIYQVDRHGPVTLHWRDKFGQNYTSGLHGKVSRKAKPDVDFREPPEVGTVVHCKRGALTLGRVEPYTRKDGAASFILHWMGDDGAEYTSGRRGLVNRVKPKADPPLPHPHISRPVERYTSLQA